jgi:hypothetical protein
MKTKSLLLLTVIAALALSACSSEADAGQPSAEEILSTVNTAVALTSMSQPQAQIVDSEAAAPPIASFAPASTAAVFATATLIQSISTPTYSSYAAASVCDNSLYIKDITIPDGTVFTPNTAFKKTWRIQNTGTCTWNSNYNIIFSSGNSMSGATTAISQSVSPNETGDISVELTAPDADGTYTGYWILSNSSGTAFGNYVYVQIVVAASASTSTPTPTATTESTATIAPTSTTEPTVAPTVEPTAVPAEETATTTES